MGIFRLLPSTHSLKHFWNKKRGGEKLQRMLVFSFPFFWVNLLSGALLLPAHSELVNPGGSGKHCHFVCSALWGKSVSTRAVRTAHLRRGKEKERGVKAGECTIKSLQLFCCRPAYGANKDRASCTCGALSSKIPTNIAWSPSETAVEGTENDSKSLCFQDGEEKPWNPRREPDMLFACVSVMDGQQSQQLQALLQPFCLYLCPVQDLRMCTAQSARAKTGLRLMMYSYTETKMIVNN